MNDKLRGFERASGLEIYGLGLDRVKWESAMEKFAELIVKECIEQCTANDSNDEWDKGVRWAANQIKQHFGVEE